MVRTMRLLPSRPLNSYLLIALWLAVSVLGGLLAYQGFVKWGLGDARDAGDSRLERYAASLLSEADRFAFVPALVALQPEVQQLLRTPQNRALQRKANQYLETLNSQIGTLNAYVLNRKGHVLAASNWQQPDSFVGEDLSFRPYVQQALKQGKGRYFGIGTIRGEPGYYLTSLWGEGAQQGIAVVKVGLAQLEQFWSHAESPVLVSDENQVVILSNVEAWRFATLQPLDEARRGALEVSLQYNGRVLKPLDWHWQQGPEGFQLLRLPPRAADPQGKSQAGDLFLVQSRPLAGTPWQITVLSPLSRTLQLARSRAWLAAVMTALALLTLQIAVQRRRHQQALEQARQGLEIKVQQRTADLLTANTALQQEVAERIQTEQTLRAAQDELVQAGKMAVLGQLSTEMAHELNQPLTALRTLASNSQRFLERGQTDVAQRNLQRMVELTERMGFMTGQLRNFARKSAGDARAVLVASLLDGAQDVLEVRIARSAAVVVSALTPPDLQVWCDANRVQQVLVNLMANALDAMQGLSQPRLEIDCQASGQWARIIVRDHGPGLSEDARKRLFEPFFTTKSEGLGLGLSLSADIVRASGGSLQASNHPKGGAVFQLLLPMVDTLQVADVRIPL